jgi:hypothetical protein
VKIWVSSHPWSARIRHLDDIERKPTAASMTIGKRNQESDQTAMLRRRTRPGTTAQSRPWADLKNSMVGMTNGQALRRRNRDASGMAIATAKYQQHHRS